MNTARLPTLDTVNGPVGPALRIASSRDLELITGSVRQAAHRGERSQP